MARTHARVYTSIWADPDFIARTERAQRMFLFLLSQPDVEHSGVLALRERRWTHGSAESTLDGIRGALAELIEHRFIVIDEDTEELLIRSFMRWDNVWKQPNIAKAAASHIRTLTSAPIRAALLSELCRVNLDDANLKPNVLDDVKYLLESLISDLGEGFPDAPRNPSANPSRNPSELASPKGSGEGGNCSSEGLPPSPTPSPSTSTAPSISDASLPRRRGTRIPDDFHVTREMVTWARSRCPNVDGARETEKFVNYWQAKSGKDATKVDWLATWKNWMLTAAERTPASASAAQTRGSTTDARVAQTQALKERFRTPEQGALAIDGGAA